VADRYPVGAQFSGKIVRSTDFGLFVEVEPGIDGLVHFSQLPFGMKQGDPAIAIGTAVSGWVREVDPSKKRLSLSLREVATTDPWEGVNQRYSIGKVVEGTVDHGGAPGIFIQLEPGLTGLVPNSEITVAPGGDPSAVRVMSVDAQRKRISLSHEAAKAAADREEYQKFEAERAESANEGESAMALAFRKAMEKKK
jgi:small subunit ribosomal protein S1